MQTRWLVAVWLGALTIVLGALLVVVLPRDAPALPTGFWTPVVAFEFARSPADVAGVLGTREAPRHAALISAMDLGNTLDFAFMLAYGGFLFAVASAVGRERRRPLASLAALLSLTAVAADGLENVQLFAITAALRAGADYTSPLLRLGFATWVKWGSLLVAFACLVPWLFREGALGKLVCLLTALGVSAALLTPLLRGVMHETMAASIFAMFVALLVLAIRRWRASRVGALSHSLNRGPRAQREA